MESETTETDNYEDLYTSDDESKHSQLVSKLLSLHKTQNVKKSTRTEPTLQITEFNLVGRSQDGVRIEDLTDPLKARKNRAKISDKVSKLRKTSKPLPRPLEKPQADRIQRAVTYEKARLALDRWEGVVTSNRVQTQLKFPLESDFKLEKKHIELGPTAWTLKTALERELEALDSEAKDSKAMDSASKTEVYNVETKTDPGEFPLTLGEVLERRKELAKMRAYQSVLEAKARRLNKIKSKKYHRIQKRERIKQQLKAFELLQKTDPEEALKKLDEIDKARVQERFSLRHKNTGQWAKNKQIRAKYDKESRQVLAQQLTISRELTKKVNTDRDSEESEEEKEEKTGLEFSENDKDNPWVNGMNPDKALVDFVSGYRKFWNKQNLKQSEDIEEENLEEREANEGIEEKEGNNVVLNEEKIEELPEEKMSFMQLTRMKKLKLKQINKADQETNTKKPKKKQGSSKSNENSNATATDQSESKKVKKQKKKKSKTSDVSTVGVEEMFSKLEKKMLQKKLTQAKRLEKSLNGGKAQKNPKKAAKPKKIDLTMRKPITKPIIDAEMTETPTNEIASTQSTNEIASSDLEKINSVLNTESSSATNIDTENFLKITKTTRLASAVPDLVTQDEVDGATDDISLANQEAMCEAFQDDDIADDFRRDKQKHIDADRPKDIDLSLPGWGSWGGDGIKPDKRKKRRFIIKAPEQMPRRDDNKGDLILNERAAKKIKEHLVSEVPFPFKSVKDFEASIRAPLGNTFVTEAAFRKLTKPAVRTKIGTVINAMTRDYVLEKNS